jgi:lipopolysaccharide transport system permease protein
MTIGTAIEPEPTSTLDVLQASSQPQAEQPPTPCITTTIRPRSGWQPVNFAEIWRYRELLMFLIWRDVKVRYKQTVLGSAWAIIQPVMTMIVFTIFFGRFGGMAQHVSVPYPVFAYAGLLAWTYFATTISNAGSSLVSSSNLISKVYFPRLIIPLSTAGVGLVDFAVAAVLMFVLLAWYGVALTAQVFLLPLFLGLAVVAAVGVGTLLAALVIAYRDFRYVLGFMVQLWMFACPLAYPVDVVPERWRLLYAINPMVGVIDGFCAALTGTALRWDIIGVSAASAVALLVIGLFYFKRIERRFADIV